MRQISPYINLKFLALLVTHTIMTNNFLVPTNRSIFFFFLARERSISVIAS
jgi:hypothetical protein